MFIGLLFLIIFVLRVKLLGKRLDYSGKHTETCEQSSADVVSGKMSFPDQR